MTKDKDWQQKQVVLKQLRRRIGDILPEFKNGFQRHDENLLKFLRARDYDVEKTEEMLRKVVEWRKVNHVDDILKRPLCKQLHSYISYHLTGFDKVGHPVIVAPVGRWNPAGALHPDLASEAPIMLIQFCEQITDLFAQISTDSSMITSYLPILDIACFDYSLLAHTEAISMGLNLIREIVQILLNNYPEAIFKIVIVNAPAIYHIVWAVVKPMLTARSLSRIHIFGSNKDAWRQVLLEHIDPDNLPSQYGGANTTCLVSNKFTIDHGLMDLPQLETLPEADLCSHLITAGKEFTVEKKCDVGDTLLWNFKTEVYDIGFEVQFQDDVLIEKCRVDSQLFLQKGVLVCKRSGKYKLTFDNTFSYRTDKKLQYAVTHRRCSGPCNLS